MQEKYTSRLNCISALLKDCFLREIFLWMWSEYFWMWVRMYGSSSTVARLGLCEGSDLSRESIKSFRSCEYSAPAGMGGLFPAMIFTVMLARLAPERSKF